jgi:hypothetical protein
MPPQLAILYPAGGWKVSVIGSPGSPQALPLVGSTSIDGVMVPIGVSGANSP